jgi:hypothetical protein
MVMMVRTVAIRKVLLVVEAVAMVRVQQMMVVVRVRARVLRMSVKRWRSYRSIVSSAQTF